MDPSVWQQALRELELQMTRATFDAWLRGTECIDVDGETLVVAAQNNQAVEWLGSGRLYTVIERTLHRITGNGAQVRFVVQGAPAPSPTPGQDEPPASGQDAPHPNTELVAELTMLLRRCGDPETRRIIQQRIADLTGEEDDPDPSPPWAPPEFDARKGWFKVHAYTSRFWGAYLGPKAFRLWEAIVKHDRRRTKTPWTPPRRFAAPQLARELGYKSIQVIVGVDRRCAPDHPDAFKKTPRNLSSEAAEERWYYHRDGALDQLVNAGLARVTAHGARRHKTYEISVKTTPGWLSPDKLAQLDADLQVEHDKWVSDAGEDPDIWHDN